MADATAVLERLPRSFLWTRWEDWAGEAYGGLGGGLGIGVGLWRPFDVAARWEVEREGLAV